MPKISREGGPTYAGNEGVVRDARDELYTVNPVRDDAEVREPGDPNTDSAEQARRDAEEAADERGRQNQQTDTAVQHQAQTQQRAADGQDAEGGDSRSGGNSSKASSMQRGTTTNKK